MCVCVCVLVCLRLTLLPSLLLGAVDVVFELDADLPLVGLVSDEGVFQQLVGGGTLGIVLHQGAFNEAAKLLRPEERREAICYFYEPIYQAMSDEL